MRFSTDPFVESPNQAWIFLAKLLKLFNIVDLPEKNAQTKEIDESDPLTIKWRYICSVSMLIFILPFVYQRNLANLRYISLLIVLSIFYTVCVNSNYTRSLCYSSTATTLPTV